MYSQGLGREPLQGEVYVPTVGWVAAADADRARSLTPIQAKAAIRATPADQPIRIPAPVPDQPVTRPAIAPVAVLPPPAPDFITQKLNPVAVATITREATARTAQATAQARPILRAIQRDDTRRATAVAMGEARRVAAQQVFRQAGVKVDEAARDAVLVRRHAAEQAGRRGAMPTMTVPARINGKLVAVQANANPAILAAAAAAGRSSERDDGAPAIVRAATAPSPADAAAAAATGTGRADPATVATATLSESPALAGLTGKGALIGVLVLASLVFSQTKGRR